MTVPTTLYAVEFRRKPTGTWRCTPSGSLTPRKVAEHTAKCFRTDGYEARVVPFDIVRRVGPPPPLINRMAYDFARVTFEHVARRLRVSDSIFVESLDYEVRSERPKHLTMEAYLVVRGKGVKTYAKKVRATEERGGVAVTALYGNYGKAIQRDTLTASVGWMTDAGNGRLLMRLKPTEILIGGMKP